MLDSICRRELSDFIADAFRNVRLGDGIGMFEADAADNYASEEQREVARQKDRSNWIEWGDIPSTEIDSSHWILCFVDAEGMRFLLPAYMMFALENYDKSNSASVDSVIYALERGNDAFEGNAELLSQCQKSAIVGFLKYMILVVGEDLVDTVAASRAYENHWAQYDVDA